jgi:predicted nucleic acid-binding protein
VDTSYVVALATATDQFHEKAIDLARQIPVGGVRMLTTQGVLLEVGNSLAKRRYRSAGFQLLQYLVTDPEIEVVTIDADLLDRGLQLFQSRQDKEWGLVDCISFVVMKDRSLSEAFTSDEHFEQAGFAALLRQ